MLDAFSLDSAIKLSTPLAKKIFSDKIKPFLTGKISKYLKNKSEIKSFENKSVKYIAQSTGQCSTMNTIAFPNTPKKLEELYLPLKIYNDDGTEIVIDDDADIFKFSNKILVNDTAGMGKSTLSKKVFLNIVKQDKYIPVFIELRQLKAEPIENQIATKFGINTDSPSEFLNQLPLVYIFDGLDEVLPKDQKYIIKFIRNFLDQLNTPKVLITSRLESYLSEFYDFSRFTIKPLLENEAFSLISKYDSNNNISAKLISGIKDSRDQGIKEFLSTPLYVSLLFCSYRYKTVIPQKKHLFYSQVYEALFDSHDLSKEIGFIRPKHSNLDSSEFHILLRRLSFWCLRNGGKIEFQKDELEIILREIISNTNGINTSAVDFVKDLTTTVPLFLKEGSSLRWSHKSLMEYFSSMFVCNDTKEKQQELLLQLYRSSEWSSYKNVFELCADIDFNSFRASIVKKVLEDFLLYRSSNYQNITNTRIKQSDIEIRIGLSFHTKFGFKITNTGEFNVNDSSFWGDDSPAVLLVKNKCVAKYSEVLQYVLHLSTDFAIHGIDLVNREKMILSILKNKCSMLFLNGENDSTQGSRSFETKIKNSSLKKNKLYILNDDPKELFNNSKNFYLINYLLAISSGGLVLNPTAVQSEIDNITLDSSNGIDQLIGQLNN